MFISPDGEEEHPLQLKTELASKILDRVERMLKSSSVVRGPKSEAR